MFMTDRNLSSAILDIAKRSRDGTRSKLEKAGVRESDQRINRIAMFAGVRALKKVIKGTSGEARAVREEICYPVAERLAPSSNDRRDLLDGADNWTSLPDGLS